MGLVLDSLRSDTFLARGNACSKVLDIQAIKINILPLNLSPEWKFIILKHIRKSISLPHTAGEIIFPPLSIPRVLEPNDSEKNLMKYPGWMDHGKGLTGRCHRRCLFRQKCFFLRLVSFPNAFILHPWPPTCMIIKEEVNAHCLSGAHKSKFKASNKIMFQKRNLVMHQSRTCFYWKKKLLVNCPLFLPHRWLITWEHQKYYYYQCDS